MFPPGMTARRRPLDSLTRLAAAGVLFLTAAAGAWDLHHEGEHCLQGGPVAACTALHPDAPLHVESAPSAEARTCAACLLRAQTRGLDLPAAVALGPAPSPATPLAETGAAAPERPIAAAVPARGPPASVSPC